MDDSNAEAHTSLALHLDRTYLWKDAEREYHRAIQLNPMYASAHQWYYMHLMTCGRPEEAARELALAEDADPLSPIILFHRACHAWFTGTDSEALAAWNRSSELAGFLDFAGFYELVFYVTKSMRPEALEMSKKLDASAHPWFGEASRAMLLAVLDRREEAHGELSRLVAVAKDRYIPAYYLAWSYGALGEADPFFEWLLRSADEQGRSPFEFVVFPTFEKMRRDPRFTSYLRRVALLD